MPIIRRTLDFELSQTKFTQIPNDWLRDTKLSLKAKGLLAQLLSHSPGWQLTVETLARDNNCGAHLISSAVQELETHGYLARMQTKTDNGRFAETLWFTTSPSLENPLTENPLTENPLAENHALKNTKEKKTNIKKTTREGLATRLPEDFTITTEMRQWANDTVPGVDIDWHTEGFKDYWTAKSSNATKKDWVATWRNWMRNTADRAPNSKTRTRLSNAQKNMLGFNQAWKGNHEEN
jgi:hypothetical protein